MSGPPKLAYGLNLPKAPPKAPPKRPVAAGFGLDDDVEEDQSEVERRRRVMQEAERSRKEAKVRYSR
jgi:hypothetical protein